MNRSRDDCQLIGILRDQMAAESGYMHIILGGGGHARVVAELLRKIGAKIEGYTDPSSASSLGYDIDYLGGDDVLKDYSQSEVRLVLGVGSSRSNQARARLFGEMKEEGFTFSSIVHPSAVFASDVSMDEGVQLMAGSVVQSRTSLARNAIVNTNAAVDHDCRIGPNVHVAPGSTISGGVVLEEAVHVGAGASIIQGVCVGTGSTIGAGAVVINDVPPNTTVVGVPAQPK
jgi:UDP-perosamine 4-acetyltransferase